MVLQDEHRKGWNMVMRYCKPGPGRICVNCGRAWNRKQECTADFIVPRETITKSSAPEPKPLKDYNRRSNGQLEPVTLVMPPCKHLGDRLRATEARTATCSGCWTPIYKCELHSLCTPFGTPIDADVIHGCPGCTDYA